MVEVMKGKNTGDTGITIESFTTQESSGIESSISKIKGGTVTKHQMIISEQFPLRNTGR